MFLKNVVICLLFILFMTSPSFGSQTKLGAFASVPLQNCKDDQLGIQLLCNEGWGLQVDEDALLLIINEDPAVTMTISRIDTNVSFLEQLSQFKLDQSDQYADGFVIERVMMGEHEAVHVKAFSKVYPEIRLNDYYLLHKGSLYGLLFSVNPKEEWDNYKFLIQKMVNSFEFTSEQKYPSFSRLKIDN